jgi:hypothetical protein
VDQGGGGFGVVHCGSHLCPIAGVLGAVWVVTAPFGVLCATWGRMHHVGHRCTVVGMVGTVWVIGALLRFLAPRAGWWRPVQGIGVSFGVQPSLSLLLQWWWQG